MKSYVVLLAMLCSTVVFAKSGKTIATNEWEYQAPPGWTMNREVSPPQSIGPTKELVQFSSSALPSPNGTPAAASIRTKMESAACELIERAAEADDLRIVRPFKKIVLGPELKIWEVDAESKDGKDLFAQFVLSGPHALILVTYEARATATSLNAIRYALFHIKWAA